MPRNNELNLKRLFEDHPALMKHFMSDDATLRTILFQKVDESDFSLIDWVDSLVMLHRWLDRQGLILSPRDSLGYISCAAKSVEDSSLLNHLPSLVHDFLEQYGCELAVKK